MQNERKGQGALEYLMLIGGGVLVAGVVLVLVLGTQGSAKDPREIALVKIDEQKQQAQYGYYIPGGIPVSNVSGYWNFNDGTGKEVVKGNNATLEGDNAPTVLSGTSCKTASCIGLDYQDDQYIKINKNQAELGMVTNKGPSTVALWFKPDHMTGKRNIFADNYREWGIYQSGTTLYGEIRISRIGSTINGGTLTPNKWYHVALTHEHLGSPASSVIKMYVNGKLVGQGSASFSSDEGYADPPFAVGADYTGGTPSGYFDGTVDDVVIFNRALTEQEVMRMYLSYS